MPYAEHLLSTGKGESIMKCFNIKSAFFLSLVFIVSTGCSYPFSRAVYSKADKTMTFSMVHEHPESYKGQYVLWGGQIIHTTNRDNGSEITVLQMPLDADYFPLHLNRSEGRFIVKSPAFLDPEIYKRKTRITVIGEVAGQETRPLYKTHYTYPVLNIKQIHPWEENCLDQRNKPQRDLTSGWDAYIEWNLYRNE
jgi:outer membrane lipoprotein